MSRHLSDEDIERYGRREMAAEELLAADDHLVSCDSCYARFGGNEALKQAYAAAGRLLHAEDDSHIGYDDLLAHVEGCLTDDDEKKIQEHLDVCPACEADAADLALAKRSLDPERLLVPRSRIERPAIFRRSPMVRWAATLATAGLIAAVAIWVAVATMRSRLEEVNTITRTQGETIERLESRVAELTEQNTELHRELQANQLDLAYLRSRIRETPGRDAPVPPLPPWIPLSLVDGGNILSIDSKGRLSGFESASAGERQLIKRALTSGYLSTARVLARLTGPSASVMGGSTNREPYALLSPVATVVESRTPTLRWHSQSGAGGYVIAVFDGNLDEVSVSERISSTEWTVTRPLRQGRIYTWQVKVFIDGDTVKLPRTDEPDAKFSVLDRSKANAVRRAREKHAGSHLMLAAVYAEAGMIDEAERELEQLAQANPNSAIARQLLRNLKSLRPLSSR